jgi:protein SCO1/2
VKQQDSHRNSALAPGRQYWRAGLLALLLAVAGCRPTGSAEAAARLAPVRDEPSFAFASADGHTVTKNDFSGHIHIAYFFFTSCGGTCPIMSASARELQKDLADVPDFRIAAFTVDPENDTPERLSAYAAKYNAKKGTWFFLRGSVDSVAALASLGFMMGDSSTPALHSTRFALVDRAGVIRGYFDGTDTQKMIELREAVRLLAEEGA